MKACCILSFLAAKSTPPSSGKFLDLFSRLLVSAWRSAARALDAEVLAVETGCRGLELRSGGDFIASGAEMYALRRVFVPGCCFKGLRFRRFGDFLVGLDLDWLSMLEALGFSLGLFKVLITLDGGARWLAD